MVFFWRDQVRDPDGNNPAWLLTTLCLVPFSENDFKPEYGRTSLLFYSLPQADQKNLDGRIRQPLGVPLDYGLLSVIRFYWCPVPSLFIMPMSFHSVPQANRPRPKAQARVRLERVCHRSPEEVESSNAPGLSSVTAQRTDEIDSVLQLVGLSNIHQYCWNRLPL